MTDVEWRRGGESMKAAEAEGDDSSDTLLELVNYFFFPFLYWSLDEIPDEKCKSKETSGKDLPSTVSKMSVSVVLQTKHLSVLIHEE